MYLIGIDCSTNPSNVGIALADLQQAIRVCEVHAGVGAPWSKVEEWLSKRGTQKVLIALDAPLGWPCALGCELITHSAGETVRKSSNEVFRRLTDRRIKESTGQQPLDVGADRIARTAHATLKELDALRTRCGISIPLAWSPDEIEGVHAIEVYPAATLKSHGLRCSQYKDMSKSEHFQAREEITNGLPGIKLPDDCRTKALGNADALDAVVCLLAAADFVRGNASPPPKDKIDIARKEGWIWCRNPKNQSTD